MGPSAVVAEAPPLNGALRIGEGEKPVLVQALVPEPAVERLDEGVVHGLARTTELELHAVLMGPGVERLAPELRSIVHRDALRQPARATQSLEDRDDARTPEAHIDLDHRALAGARIHHGQRAERAPIGPRVSRTKSIAPCSLGAVAPGTATRATATRFRPRRRTARPSSR